MAEFFIYILLGFIAEMIDGCLGMAYGVFLTSCLSLFGIPFINISACVHGSEVFVSLASGLSHLRFGNVDKKLLFNLAFFGAIGGIIGAVSLKILDGSFLKPVISVYLLLLGIRILIRAIRKKREIFKKAPKYLKGLGFIGGFFDAIGGGGWGPIVTSNLLESGLPPDKTVGTVNLAEFFVTLVQSATFLLILGLVSVKLMLGLILGGIIAAPIAAAICKKVNSVIMMYVIAFVIILINSINIVKWLEKLL